MVTKSILLLDEHQTHTDCGLRPLLHEATTQHSHHVFRCIYTTVEPRHQILYGNALELEFGH